MGRNPASPPCHGDLHGRSPADDRKLGGIACGVGFFRRRQLGHGRNIRPVNPRDDVARPQSGRRRGAIGIYRIEIDTLGQPGLPGHLRVDRARGYAQTGFVGHISVVDDVLNQSLHVIDRDGKADALHGPPVAAGIFGGDDPHHLAGRVEQRAELPGLMEASV